MPELTTSSKLQSALAALIPDGVAAASGFAAIEPGAFDYREEGEPLATAVVARRNEFICGRQCARTALAQVGFTPCALPPDADGLPMWPRGSIASISHSRGLCCAVAAPVGSILSLGLDLEKTTRLSPRAMARVLHPLELNAVGGDQVIGSLLFSAKEAFFKAQFPHWRAQPNFKDLALQFDVSSKQMSIREIAPHLPAGLREAASQIAFRYHFFGDYVVTLCWLNRA